MNMRWIMLTLLKIHLNNHSIKTGYNRHFSLRVPMIYFTIHDKSDVVTTLASVPCVAYSLVPSLQASLRAKKGRLCPAVEQGRRLVGVARQTTRAGRLGFQLKHRVLGKYAIDGACGGNISTAISDCASRFIFQRNGPASREVNQCFAVQSNVSAIFVTIATFTQNDTGAGEGRRWPP
jgi:hypothetical protein